MEAPENGSGMRTAAASINWSRFYIISLLLYFFVFCVRITVAGKPIPEHSIVPAVWIGF